MAVALGLILIIGSLILGSLGAGSAASAAGPASVFYGYVFADTDETTPPARVRAVSTSGAVCGSAEVVPHLAGVGFYAVAVVSADQKAGCPVAGAVVQFTLLSGRVDDGVWAGQLGTYQPGEVQRVNLNASAPSFSGWSSGSTGFAGVIVLRWVGADGTLLSQALSSIALTTVSVARPSSSGVFEDIGAQDGTLNASDLVLVRFR